MEGTSFVKQVREFFLRHQHGILLILVMGFGVAIALSNVSFKEFWSRDSYQYLQMAADFGSWHTAGLSNEITEGMPPLLLLLLRLAGNCGIDPAWFVIGLNLGMWCVGVWLIDRLAGNLFRTSASQITAVVLYATFPGIYHQLVEIQRDMPYIFLLLSLLVLLSEITAGRASHWKWAACGIVIVLGTGFRREGLELPVLVGIWLCVEYWRGAWALPLRQFCIGIAVMMIAAILSIGAIKASCWWIAGLHFEPFQVDRIALLWNRLWKIY